MKDRINDAYPSTTRHEPKPTLEREVDDDILVEWGEVTPPPPGVFTPEPDPLDDNQ
jgi:hypothetical protein